MSYVWAMGRESGFVYYAYRKNPPTKTDCYPDKAATLVFSDNRLLSYDLLFDPKIVERIPSLKTFRAGVTTRSEVVAVLGRPTSQSGYVPALQPAFHPFQPSIPGTLESIWDHVVD